MRQALLVAALMVLVCILAQATHAQDVLLDLAVSYTVRVADYDDGIFVAGTQDGKLYVLDEAGNYTVTDLGAGRVNDIRIERPYIAVAAGSTVVELRLGSLTPQELWRRIFNIWNDHTEEISSLDLSEDGNYVAYFARATDIYTSDELGVVGVLTGGGGGGAIIDHEFTDGLAAINYWLDATGDMARIATSQPFTDGVDYFGYEAGTALYHFDGSNLEFQWWTLQEVDYEVTEVRVSENKDYVAAATSSGTFMWLLRMSNGDSLASYETPCKEQFACDGDDNLNYVIGANKGCECVGCPPYDWFILNNDGGAGYSVALEGTMDDPIDDLDATSDGTYFAFGSQGGDYVVLGRHSDITEEASGDVGVEIDAVELGHCGTLLLGGDRFLKLLRFAAGYDVVYVNVNWAGEPCGADLGTGINGESIVRCCNGFDNIPDAHAAVAVGGTIITYDGTYYPPGLVVTKDGITIKAGSRPVIDGAGDVGFHIRADNVTVIGYEFTNCLWALVIGPDPLGGPITGFAVHNCYFNDNINDWALEVEYHPGLVDAELNYWDSCTGPTHPDNPGGRGEIIQVNDFAASIDYVPWLHPCAATWGDTCLDNSLTDDPEDFLMGSGAPDQDLYAVGFCNPGGEARLTSVSFQWYDPGEVDLYVYLGPEGTCPVCLADDGGPMLADFALDTIASGSFIGNWEWETVGLEDGPCIQIPAKSCFYIVWKMREGMDRPRILADAGHSESYSWIWNGENGYWKCFDGYEYMVKVCLNYDPWCIELHATDIHWTHESREYPCVGDDYVVNARFHNYCGEDKTIGVNFYEAPWGLFAPPSTLVYSRSFRIYGNREATVVRACGYYHHPDKHNWWARNIVVEWTRNMNLCYEEPEPTWYRTRRCRMTIWPDGPWDKQPVRWGLAPITIPVYNEHGEDMQFQLSVEDLPDLWRADLSWTERTLSPGATADVILTVWPEGDVEPDWATVIKVKAFTCSGEWGEVEIEFLPYPVHFYLGPDGLPVQPVHVEDIRWSPRYPCENMPYDVSATVVNDGPNSAYPKISFGLAPWGCFFPAFEGSVFDTVLWGGIGGFARQVVAPYHYKIPWFVYEDLECNYYQQYARNIVIDYPVIRRHCLTPERDEFDVWTGGWIWTAEDSTTEYFRDCERWLWPKHRWVSGDSTWRPVVIPIPVYNEEPHLDAIILWVESVPVSPGGEEWRTAFDNEYVSEFTFTTLWPGEVGEVNLSIIPQGDAPPDILPARVVVGAAKLGMCVPDTHYIDIKFMPYTGMCIRDTFGIKVGYKYAETCDGQDPTLLPGDKVDIGLMLDNEFPVSAAQIDLWYESEYMRVVDVQTTTRTTGFELVERELAPGTHEIALYSTPAHPVIIPNNTPPISHCELPPGYNDVGLLSIVTVTFEVLPGAPAGQCADIWYGTVILDGLPDWEGHPKEPLCLKFEDKGQICFGGYIVPNKCDVTGLSAAPDTMVTLMDLFAILNHIVGKPGYSLGDIENVFNPTKLIWAADANGDGLVNILDLMKCINLAVGVCDPKVAVADVAVGEVAGMAGRTVVVPVNVTSEQDVAGLLLRFRYDQKSLVVGMPELTERSEGMDLSYRVIGDELVVFVSGMRGEAIEAGAGAVVRVPFTLAEDVKEVSVEVVEPVVFTVDEAISFGHGSMFVVKSDDLLPAEFSLAQNYPNPFNPVTSITYSLPQAAKVKVVVYNTLGQVVAELVDRNQEAGHHVVTWDAGDLASGVYFYRIQANEFKATRRMVLMK